MTVNKVNRSSDCPTASDSMLQVITTGEAFPGYGGFVRRMTSKAGGVFYHTVVAKLPKGYQLERFANSCGDGADFTWLTPNQGTGNFEFYAYKLTCGTSGTFSTFGHLALVDADAADVQAQTATTVPIAWYVAYSQVFDATGLTMNGDALTVGLAPTTLTAVWREYSPVAGDLNGDNTVNAKDVTYLRRYLAGGYGVTLAEESAADLNGDGYANAKDVTVLRRFLAGGYGIVLN